MTSPDQESLLDQVIDERYHILGKVGAGGVGVVYRAEHIKLRREVAVKVLQREYASKVPLQRRFEREARAMAALAHPGIVNVTDYGLWKELPYVVMELLEGRSLRERMSAERLKPPELIQVVTQILNALSYAHSQGLVHRDLKPANIFLKELHDGSNAPCILDFGLAKFVTGDDNADGGPKLTVTGVAFGTPTYMAPEQTCGGATDHRTDLYSIGVMLFELITGHLPFTGDTGELMRQHLLQPPPRLSKFFSGVTVPPVLEEFFDKALAKEPSARFEDAKQMGEALMTLAAPLEKLLKEEKDSPSSAPTVAEGAGDQATAATIMADGVVDQGTAQTILAGNHSLQSNATPKATMGDEATAPTLAAVNSTSPRAKDELGRATTEPAPTSDASPDPVKAKPEAGIKGPLLLIIVAFSGLMGLVGVGVLLSLFYTPAESELMEGVPEFAPESAQTPLLSRPVPNTNPAEKRPITPSPQLPDANVLWDAQTPALLSNAKARLDSGAQVSESTVRQLRAFAMKNGDDPRPLILLARYRLKRRHRPDALDRYSRAFDVSPLTKNDPAVLPDLITLATHRQLGWKAAQLVTEHYGASALPTLDRALSNPDLDAGDRQRLQRLRRELQ